MPWVTGVELGPESCVLARVRTAGDRIQLSAVRGQTDEDWDSSRTLAQNLANARRGGRFSRTARVVVWGLESASETDAVAFGPVSPLREAGFTIDAVMTPAQALTVLSSRWPRDSQNAIVWLALNRHRAAIAIIDSGRLLYSREFDWHYRPAATVREELLQRYSLVAHLAPEIRHGLDVVSAQHGAAPGGIVTCGDLPELRSLTMPLIEELDIEVETLDTVEGLDLDRSADREILTEKASALYLAVAAGVKVPEAQAIEPARRWLAAAGVVAVVAMLLMGGWLTVRSVSHRTPEPASVAAPPAPARQAQTPAVRPSPAPVEPPARTPEASTPAATTGRREPQGQKPAAATAAAPRREEGVQPLRDPLPVVNSILVAPDRRLAVVGGEIVREGDAIGRRVLIRIERDGLLLREPSGHEVRVYIRRRVGSPGVKPGG
jgi:hypothetical protein